MKRVRYQINNDLQKSILSELYLSDNLDIIGPILDDVKMPLERRVRQTFWDMILRVGEGLDETD
jgi:hypothetical protein